ncbi:hypothetical protein M422DRAFT_245553 [Sphaerobolus stellatus SS14]|nr:hypothetical protein M422DRAFT_245553 [Sphaerobolus stellatus SS14]
MTELPYDVWIQIADKITVRQDLFNLSETCQIARLATIPVLFRTVTFAGSGGNFTRTHGQCFSQLCRTRALIALCAHNNAILSAMRHVRITYWSGIFDDIWMRQNLEGGSTNLRYLPDYSALVESDGHPPPPYEKLPTSLRRCLHKLLAVVYQELADLIRLAPNLQSVTVFDEEAQRPRHFDMRWKPSEFGEHGLSFPWRWGTSLRYNWIELDVKGHLRPQDPTQVILPTPLPLSTPLDKQPDTAKQQEKSLIAFLDTIDLPIRTASLHALLLPQLSPAILSKLRNATKVYVYWLYSQSEESLGSLLENLASAPFKSLQLDLSIFNSIMNNNWTGAWNVNLHHLTSYNGPSRVLYKIIPLAPNLRAIYMIDCPLFWQGGLQFVLPPEPMPQVYHLGFCWDPRLTTESIQQTANIWPSVKELYFDCSFTKLNNVLEPAVSMSFSDVFNILSPWSDLETLHFTSRSRAHTLNQNTAFDLRTTPPPHNSALQVITFWDSSLAYWNASDTVWEFDVRLPTSPNICFSPEEMAKSVEILMTCWTKWNTGIPQPNVANGMWSALKGVVGKGKMSYWEPIYGDIQWNQRRSSV